MLPVSSVFSEISSTGYIQPPGEKQPNGVKQPIDNSQNSPLGGMFFIPKWYSDAIVAANCYSTGMSYISSDPKLAVQAFELGLNYARKAAAEGAGEQIVSLSKGLSKELAVAEANLAKDKSNDGSDSTAKNDGSANQDNNHSDSQNRNQGVVTTSAPKSGVISSQTFAGSYHLGSLGNSNSGNSSGRARAGM